MLQEQQGVQTQTREKAAAEGVARSIYTSDFEGQRRRYTTVPLEPIDATAGGRDRPFQADVLTLLFDAAHRPGTYDVVSPSHALSVGWMGG